MVFPLAAFDAEVCEGFANGHSHIPLSTAGPLAGSCRRFGSWLHRSSRFGWTGGQPPSLPRRAGAAALDRPDAVRGGRPQGCHPIPQSVPRQGNGGYRRAAARLARPTVASRPHGGARGPAGYKYRGAVNSRRAADGLAPWGLGCRPPSPHSCRGRPHPLWGARLNPVQPAAEDERGRGRFSVASWGRWGRVDQR